MLTRREAIALAGCAPAWLGAPLAPGEMVPFRWAPGWTDPKLIALFEGGPVNCLVVEGSLPPSVVEAAHRAGIAVREWDALAPAPLAQARWTSTAPTLVITGAVWPRLTPVSGGGRDRANAGPTGAPWIDSNSWVAQLAAARAPGKQIWLDFAPPRDVAVNEAAYRLAIADSAANGARWMVNLDERLQTGLAAGNTEALQTWRGLSQTLAFFEKRRAWRSYARQGPLGVVSKFSDASEFMSTEFLNLAARRNLLCRVLDGSRASSADLAGLRAVIYLDAEKANAQWTQRLAAFAKAGGLLIVSRTAASAFSGGRAIDCPVAGYEARMYGKGTLASISTVLH